MAFDRHDKETGKRIGIRAVLLIVSWTLLPAWMLYAALNENDYLKPLGRRKEAAPQRIKGGESFPPLPLPATPLRRTERKRPPAPPVLVGKVMWGASADFVHDDGRISKVYDWNMCPADVQQLLKKASKTLNLRYRDQAVNLNEFNGDPAEIPVLFFSGGRTVRMTDDQKKLMRNYVLSGGMIWIDSVAGSPYFNRSIAHLMSEIFPEEPLREIPLDHPIYHIATDVYKAKIPKFGRTTPKLKGIFVGCRVGVAYSEYGLGCGWDNFSPTVISEAQYYDVASASAIGMNLVGYAVGYHRLGLAHARQNSITTPREDASLDGFIFAQIAHEGIWNTDPGGPENLLRNLAVTQTRTKLDRITVRLGRDSLAGIQFLYMSGLADFQWDDAQLATLRGFLARGGTLLLDNSLGLRAFDTAVRREVKKLFSGKALAELPANHEVFHCLYNLDQVDYTPALRKTRPGLRRPCLEGMEIDQALRIIYSRYDLGGGWQGTEHPLAKGYTHTDAVKLGTNIVIYAMTH